MGKLAMSIVLVLFYAAIVRAEGQCTITQDFGLLEIAPGVDEALGKAIDNNESWRLVPYIQCKLTKGDTVFLGNRLPSLSTVTVLKSEGCNSRTRGIVFTSVLVCE